MLSDEQETCDRSSHCCLYQYHFQSDEMCKVCLDTRPGQRCEMMPWLGNGVVSEEGEGKGSLLD